MFLLLDKKKQVGGTIGGLGYIGSFTLYLEGIGISYGSYYWAVSRRVVYHRVLRW